MFRLYPKAFEKAAEVGIMMSDPLGFHCYIFTPLAVLRLQTIKTIVNSRRFKGSSCAEPRRVQVLDLYCLTRFESENSRRGDVY